MLANIITVGDKAEILKWNKPAGMSTEPTILVSKVLELQDERTIRMAMPMEKTKTILLRTGEVYDLRFYTRNGTYTCTGRVEGRYKENSMGILIMELLSAMEKVQRRKFFRVECIVDVQLHVLSSEELQQLDEYERQERERADGTEQLLNGIREKLEEWDQGIITDISGGGARFTTRSPLPKDAILFLEVELEQKEKIRTHYLFARLISSEEVDKRPGYYENRVQFLHLKPAEREEIIRFVFDEERKKLKRERSMKD